MDFGVAIIGIITIVICVVPVYLLVRSGQKRKNTLLTVLRQLAQQHGCELSSHAFGSDFVIGLDARKKFVFFHKNSVKAETSQSVDLNTILSCQAIKQTSTVQSEVGLVTVYEKLTLSFIPRDKDAATSRFELYDVTSNFQLTGELQLLDSWEKDINGLLKQR